LTVSSSHSTNGSGSSLAGSSTVLWGLVAPPGVALWLATLFAAVYYFSRNPWGSPRGDAYNEWIDGLYDRYLP